MLDSYTFKGGGGSKEVNAPNEKYLGVTKKTITFAYDV
jgi:hypothetical protein